MAEENTNSNDFKKVMMIPCAVVALFTALGLLQLFHDIVPGLISYAKGQREYKEQVKEYKNATEHLEELKSLNEQESKVSTAAPEKEFFRPVDAGTDPESMIANEFNEILQLMTANQIKTRSVEYDYAPEEDEFYKNASEKYSVCKLDMKMIASYTNFKNFMKDLYKHDHYLDIAKVEIRPYLKNKSILLIDLQLKLYAAKV